MNNFNINKIYIYGNSNSHIGTKIYITLKPYPALQFRSSTTLSTKHIKFNLT